MVVSFINDPDRFVDDRLTTLVTSKAQRALYKLGIDTTVLRTCRQIYIEALPMLYGDNNFVFFSASALDLFRDKGLVGIPRKCSLLVLRCTRTKAHIQLRREMRYHQRPLVQFRTKPTRSATVNTQIDPRPH